MLTGYLSSSGTLNKVVVNHQTDLTADMAWLDLMDPTEQERQWVKEMYGQELQFLEEVADIEASSRFYRDENGLHINQYFLLVDNNVARNVHVAFTLNKGKFFTLRADDPPAFRVFYARASKNPDFCCSPVDLLLGIIATRIEMMADLFEKLQIDLEPISRSIFRSDADAMHRVLESLTKTEDINGKARLGLLENKRAYPAFLRSPEAANHIEQINEFIRDVDSLTSHSMFLAERTKFLMDAAMGTINIAHNQRLNIFTVLSVILLPPMLVVSVYGMNFEHMPELKWIFGYPFALVLMVVAGVAPFLYLKRKGWL